MNSKYAISRLASVARVDSIAASQGDFLATHVALKGLMLPDRFSLSPTSAKSCTEEQAFRDIIANPRDRHQFVVVYGQSGSGKSHLIRWFEARFERIRPDNEVVLFIRRSDNTLKGTIRQLIAKPEVSGLARREVFERLVRAATTVDEAKLKDLIYHNFIIEVDHDDGGRDHRLDAFKRKRLSAFLNNEIVHAHMMRVDGPIERIYSKVAEGASVVDRDVVAQFLPEDFAVDADLFESIASTGADSKVEKLAKQLMADEGGAELGGELAAYMNQFVNDVVQRCAGIEPGDFRDIFNEIRRELFRMGKNLTLFIEDVTSFTGVDDALLDALIVDHSGMDAGDRLCRISAIVGTTGNYLQNNFRDNHKDRITNYIYIPSDIFDEEGILEFVARYLNAMSLPESAVEEWLTERGASAERYPVHQVVEGINWERVTLAHGKSLCLYPFTRASIRYLYAHALTRGQQTPRYIIRDIIGPVVEDALNHPDRFPGDYCPLVDYDQNLPELIGNQVQDRDEQRRVLRFLAIWGNGRPERSAEGQQGMISGIPQSYFADFGLPELQFSRSVAAPIRELPRSKPEEAPRDGAAKAADAIPQERIRRYEQAYGLLQRWEAGDAIDFSVNTGAIGTLREALKALNAYVLSAINWLDWGIPSDHIARIKNARAELIGLERQTRGECFYALPSTWESVYLICAMIRYVEYGRSSWNYPDAPVDVYRLTSWIERTRAALVDVIRERDGKRVNYVDAAIIAEIYRLILTGEYGEKSLKNLTHEDLLEEKRTKNTNGHGERWLNLLSLMRDKGADQQNRKLIRQYFDIPQGVAGRNIVLNEPEISKALSRIKRARLKLTEEEIRRMESDPVKQRREVYEYLRRITDRIGSVAQQEQQAGEQCCARIAEELDCEELEEEDLLDFVALAEDFYGEADRALFNVAKPQSLEPVKRNAARIVQALATVRGAAEEQEPLAILMAYSGEQNPILLLSLLCDLLNQLSADLEKVQKNAQARRERLADVEADFGATAMFEAPLRQLDADLDRFEERECAP